MKPHRTGRMRKFFTGGLLLGSVLWLGGCYENVGITLHEPGEYKGQNDPLLSELKQAQLQEQLNERFKAGQSDR